MHHDAVLMSDGPWPQTSSIVSQPGADSERAGGIRSEITGTGSLLSMFPSSDFGDQHIA